MPTKKEIQQSEGIFFITFTCYDWLPLFEISDCYKCVYDWFDSLKDSGHFVNAYVIMPNHLHALLSFRNIGKSINTIVGNGKIFMAYEIVKNLKTTNHDILLELEKAVKLKDASRGKLHEVWKDSFDWKECRSAKFINQKLNYIHNNPCKGKWNLAESPVDYIHSSAKFYITGQQGFYPVTNYMEMEDIDLSR